jgi:hypothetical protein
VALPAATIALTPDDALLDRSHTGIEPTFVR